MPDLIKTPQSKRTKALRHLLIAASAFTLMACATATPYQPASEPGGYDGFSQQMIENDRARITFGGNSLTKRETVENALLYRAAEMAVERGFDTFTLQERDLEEKTRLQASPSLGGRGFGYDRYFGYSFYNPNRGWSRAYPYSRFGGFNRSRGFGFNNFGGFNNAFFNNTDVREITKYRATAEVIFGRAGSTNDPQTFKAREVLENLSRTIEFPEEK